MSVRARPLARVCVLCEYCVMLHSGACTALTHVYTFPTPAQYFPTHSHTHTHTHTPAVAHMVVRSDVALTHSPSRASALSVALKLVVFG